MTGYLLGRSENLSHCMAFGEPKGGRYNSRALTTRQRAVQLICVIVDCRGAVDYGHDHARLPLSPRGKKSRQGLLKDKEKIASER